MRVRMQSPHLNAEEFVIDGVIEAYETVEDDEQGVKAIGVDEEEFYPQYNIVGFSLGEEMHSTLTEALAVARSELDDMTDVDPDVEGEWTQRVHDVVQELDALTGWRPAKR